MMSRMVSCLVLALLAPQRGATDDELTEEQRQRMKTWAQEQGPYFGVKDLEPGLFGTFRYVSLAPDDRFAPLGDKVISKGLRDRSAWWFSHLVNDNFNPWESGHKPSQYFLGDRTRRSLLRYEWKTSQLDVQVTESSAGVLFRLKPLKRPIKGRQAVSREEVVQVLGQFLHPDVVERNSPLSKKFKLPASLRVGDTFTNTGKPPGLDWIYDWAENIVGFISPEHINIVLLKAGRERMFTELPADATWLPVNLYEKDGKTPVRRKEK
jgi:hypothetical protein